MKEQRKDVHIPGLSRQEEEKKLAEIIAVAQRNLDQTKKYNKELTEELKDMQESYDTRDKEILMLWHNTESRFQESKQDMMRCLKARNKPYFGRIDFKDPVLKKEESYYIGRVGIAKSSTELLVIDWRTPAASVYYENSLGTCTYEVKGKGNLTIDLKLKRTYEIADDKLIDFYDSDVVANDELLTKYLAKSKRTVLSEIIGTIQKEQNAIIRKSPKANLIVQGVAGSGKTTVAMHRISYILYNYKMFRPEDFYVIGSNKILLNYITGVLPDLDVYGISQMTMEELFIRLLYEDWDGTSYQIKPLDTKNEDTRKKGSMAWFHKLEHFCQAYEEDSIPKDTVSIETTGVILLTEEKIKNYLKENRLLSMQGKINGLNEMLLSKLENELLGKEVSYPAEQKKELTKRCRTHFGRDVWKGSVFSLYEEFLSAQNMRPAEKGCYDVYDLAALAYLYKRIKETDGIREASHIIIDEAQDFGMMVYACLSFCLRGCTYTIMGDVSQNIHFNSGLNDWEELKKLILTGPYDSFSLLKKSYRNTVEISNFASEILRHGNFPIYPVEPILRHGNEVSKVLCSDENKLIKKTAQQTIKWGKQGYETIAVICRSEKECAMVKEKLSKLVPVEEDDLENAVLKQGIMILPVTYTKGLEFDAVILFNPSKDSYPAKDEYVKLLYVAATRALHELCVIYREELSDLIKTPALNEKRMQFLNSESTVAKREYKKQEIIPDEEKRQEELRQCLERTKKNYLKPQEQLPLKPVMGPKAVDRGNNRSNYSFNAVVDSTKLYPPGHARIDSAIRWAKKTKQYMEFTSSYGILRLTVISEEVIRIQFQKGTACEFDNGPFHYPPQERISWQARQSISQYEVSTRQVVVRLDKKTGGLKFMDSKGNLLLSENTKLPRQMEADAKGIRTWNYFDWQKEDRLRAKGILDDSLEMMNLKARYISFGGKKLRMPLLYSYKGYGLGIAADDAVFCCAIPMYGMYVATEGRKQIDYYFMYGNTYEKVLEHYKMINLTAEEK